MTEAYGGRFTADSRAAALVRSGVVTVPELKIVGDVFKWKSIFDTYDADNSGEVDKDGATYFRPLFQPFSRHLLPLFQSRSHFSVSFSTTFRSRFDTTVSATTRAHFSVAVSSFFCRYLFQPVFCLNISHSRSVFLLAQKWR